MQTFKKLLNYKWNTLFPDKESSIIYLLEQDSSEFFDGLLQHLKKIKHENPIEYYNNYDNKDENLIKQVEKIKKISKCIFYNFLEYQHLKGIKQNNFSLLRKANLLKYFIYFDDKAKGYIQEVHRIKDYIVIKTDKGFYNPNKIGYKYKTLEDCLSEQLKLKINFVV